MMLFHIDDRTGQLRPQASDWQPRELDLEKYIVAAEADGGSSFLSSSVFGEELLIVGRQIRTSLSKRADILAIDRNGCSVIVELKRDAGHRGVETQALQYLSDFSRYRGHGFIEHFSKWNPKLCEHVTSFLGDEVETDDVNNASRIILMARSFDETLYSMGEWLSSHGVGFKCVTYTPAEVGGVKLLSFSVAFDRSQTTLHRPTFGSIAREPSVFWHNIAESDQDWWEFLVERGELPACFDNSPEDQGARIMTRYVSGDRVIAYARKHGAVGWGRIEDPSSYQIVAEGSPADFAGVNCRHRIKIAWEATAKTLSDGLAPDVVRRDFSIYHPISTAVSIDPAKGELLMRRLTELFGA